MKQIKKDENFTSKIDEILNNNLDKNGFQETIVLNYKDSDLTAGLNKTTLSITGTKIEEKWKLDITITDRYDFTDFKELDEYKDSEILSIANNCAMVSVESGVIKEYDIKIQFNMEK